MTAEVVHIQCLDELRGDQLREAWEWYVSAFADISRKAMQRHTMFYEQFVDMAEDRDIWKYVARDLSGGIVGMSVITNRLTAWPLVTPEYFEDRWPKHYAEDRIWYIGFVAVTHGATTQGSETKRRGNLFRRLISTMYNRVDESEGIAFMDYCKFNIEKRRLAALTLALLNSINPNVTGGQVDGQEFWGWRFDGRDIFDVNG